MMIPAASRRWTIAAVLISILAYAVADQDAVVFVVGLPAAVIAWLITSGSPPRALPRAVINALLFVVVAWGSLTMFREGLGVSLFSEFVAALMVVKILDRRGCRDAAQILTLSVFLVIGAVLTSNAFWLGLLVLAYIPVIVAAVLWYQLARVEELSESPHAAPEGVRRTVRRRTGVIGAVSILIATAVFLLMPREVGSRTLGAWGSAAVGRVVGFNDEVQLGRGGLISESREPVLDIQFFDRAGEVVGAMGRRFYLRGAVLDTYDPELGAWVRSQQPRNNFQQGGTGFMRSMPVAVGGSRPRDWTLRQEATIRNVAGEQGHLFSVWQPNAVRVDPPARLYFNSADGALKVADHTGKVSYTVYSNTQVPRPRRWQPPDPETREAVRLGLPEIRAIAEDILRGEQEGRGEDAVAIDPDPATRPVSQDGPAAAKLRNHLQSGRFRYTLETLSAPPGRDPIEWFLTENREGHCEYFASALAAMCREVGINARVITGYVASDYNDATKSYIIRASNAHAWVEVEILPGYWSIYDPTPAADFTRIHEPERGLLADARRFLDTLEFAWIRGVVGYDADARSGLFGPPGGDTSVFPLFERIGATFERARSVAPAVLLTAVRNALIAFCLALLAGILLVRTRGRSARALLWLLSRLRALLRAGPKTRRRTPAETMHEQLLAIYRRAGCTKPGWRPLRTHNESLIGREALSGEERRASTRLVDLLYASLFAERVLAEQELREAREHLRRLGTWADRAGRNGSPGRSGTPDAIETTPGDAIRPMAPAPDQGPSPG